MSARRLSLVEKAVDGRFQQPVRAAVSLLPPAVQVANDSPIGS